MAEKAKQRLEGGLATADGLRMGMERALDLRKAAAVCTPDELVQWAAIAGECAHRLRKVRDALVEIAGAPADVSAAIGSPTDETED